MCFDLFPSLISDKKIISVFRFNILVTFDLVFLVNPETFKLLQFCAEKLILSLTISSSLAGGGGRLSCPPTIGLESLLTTCHIHHLLVGAIITSCRQSHVVVSELHHSGVVAPLTVGPAADPQDCGLRIHFYLDELVWEAKLLGIKSALDCLSQRHRIRCGTFYLAVLSEDLLRPRLGKQLGFKGHLLYSDKYRHPCKNNCKLLCKN